VSADLSDFFAAAGADADRGVLAPPEVLRRRGTARNRRNFIAVTSVVVVVLAILAGAGLAFANHNNTLRDQPGVGPGPASPTAVPTTQQQPVPPPPTTPNTPPTTATPAGPQACTASQLTYVSMTTGFAMGTAGHTFTVRNHSQAACYLENADTVTYRQGGQARQLPTTPDGQLTTLKLAAGASANFVLLHTNGYGGYPPTDPRCATLRTYGGLSLVLTDGSSLPLGDASFQVQCDGVRIQMWQPAG
jgi:hypothetical protein